MRKIAAFVRDKASEARFSLPVANEPRRLAAARG
jgi:hypothetical protein